MNCLSRAHERYRRQTDARASANSEKIELQPCSTKYYQPVVKVIWHKAESLQQMDGWGHTGATWRIQSNLCFLRPTTVHSPNGKSSGSAVFAQIMAESPYIYNGCPFPQNCPFPCGYLNLHLIWGSLGLPESSTQTASRSVQPFLQGSLLWQTDRPCYSVSNNRPHLHMQYCDAA